MEEQTLKKMVNFMLGSSRVPQKLWENPLLTANYNLKRVPHKKPGLIPFEL